MIRTPLTRRTALGLGAATGCAELNESFIVFRDFVVEATPIAARRAEADKPVGART